MMKIMPAALAVAALVILSASAATDDPIGDAKSLQGKWLAMAGPNKDIPILLEIKDKSISMTLTTPMGDERMIKGEFTLDEKAKPKQMDWVKMRIDDREVPDNKAIYSLEGDTLMIAGGGPNMDRPTEFAKEEEGKPSRTLTFKREKDEPKKDEAKKDETKKEAK